MKNIENFDIILIIILFIISIFLVYIGFFKKDAVWLETLKAGGDQNFQVVKQIYGTEEYSAQQRSSIKEGLDAFGIE